MKTKTILTFVVAFAIGWWIGERYGTCHHRHIYIPAVPAVLQQMGLGEPVTTTRLII